MAYYLGMTNIKETEAAEYTLSYCHCGMNKERILQAEDIASGLVDIECDCVPQETEDTYSGFAFTDDEWKSEMQTWISSAKTLAVKPLDVARMRIERRITEKHSAMDACTELEAKWTREALLNRRITSYVQRHGSITSEIIADLEAYSWEEMRHTAAINAGDTPAPIGNCPHMDS